MYSFMNGAFIPSVTCANVSSVFPSAALHTVTRLASKEPKIATNVCTAPCNQLLFTSAAVVVRQWKLWKWCISRGHQQQCAQVSGSLELEQEPGQCERTVYVQRGLLAMSHTKSIASVQSTILAICDLMPTHSYARHPPTNIFSFFRAKWL